MGSTRNECAGICKDHVAYGGYIVEGLRTRRFLKTVGAPSTGSFYWRFWEYVGGPTLKD